MAERPDLFSDLSLGRRLERAEAEASARFVEARARVSPQSRATWFEVAGAYAMYDGPSSPVTQTFGLGLFEAAGQNELTELDVSSQSAARRSAMKSVRWQECRSWRCCTSAVTNPWSSPA